MGSEESVFNSLDYLSLSGFIFVVSVTMKAFVELLTIVLRVAGLMIA